MHMYAVHVTRTESVCGMGMRGDGVQKRGMDAGPQISTEGERGREEEEAGNAEDGWKSEREEHKRSTTNSRARTMEALSIHTPTEGVQ